MGIRIQIMDLGEHIGFERTFPQSKLRGNSFTGMQYTKQKVISPGDTLIIKRNPKWGSDSASRMGSDSASRDFLRSGEAESIKNIQSLSYIGD
jgi:hypothetical protein